MNNIREVVAMAGAVDVPGNVQSIHIKQGEVHDNSAEWNVYWDPDAAKVVLEEHPSLNVRLFSLDATNHVPITPAFLVAFGAQYRYKMR